MADSSRSTRRSALAAGLVLLAAFVLLSGPTSAAPTADGANVTVYRAADVALDDADDVEAAIANDTVEPADELVVGETLVVAIDSNRLAESMAAGDGSTTQRFFDALDGDAAFRIAQTNPTPERPRKLAPVGPENVTVHRAGTTTYVLVDTGALAFHYRGGETRAAQPRDGDQFAVTFGYGLDEHDISGPEVELYTTTAGFLSLRPSGPLAPEVINRSVKVNIEPDEAVVARLTLGGNRTVTAPVEPVAWSGSPGVSLDLRGVEPGTAYTLELVHDGRVVDRAQGTVLEPRARVTDATLTEVTTQQLVTRDGQRVTETIADHVAVNVTVRLSHGGLVRVFDEACERVGYERVEPGVEARLSIELWDEGAPVRGRNGSEYGVMIQTFREDGPGKRVYPGPDAETTVGFDDGRCPTTDPASTDGSPEPSPRTEPDDTTETDGGQGADGGTRTPGQPGFTALAALVALVGFALVRTGPR